MDAQLARQLKIKTGALNRTLKDHLTYNNEADQLRAKVETMKQEQAALPEEEQEPGKVSRAEAELAETIAVIPTLVVKVEGFLSDLEGVKAMIEEQKAEQMEEIRQTDEWQAADASLANARAFMDSQQ